MRAPKRTGKVKGKPVVSIVGGTVWGNRGAESMLVTTIGRIRETHPEALFNVLSYYARKDRELIQDQAISVLSSKPLSMITRHFLAALMAVVLVQLGLKIPNTRFFHIARALHESDVLLDVGGITFSDGREKFLPFNILTIWPAMILGVPVVKLAQAVGPFHHKINRIPASLFLTHCSHIFARGSRSAEHLQDLGLPESHWDEVPDVAFLYKPAYSLSNEGDSFVDRLAVWVATAKKTGNQVVVLSPSVLVDLQSQKKGLDYINRFLDLVRGNRHQTFVYIVMPNATRKGSDQSHNNDLLTIQRMRAAAQEGRLDNDLLDRIAWVDEDINTASVRRIIAMADLVITSRYHAMISSLCLEKPTVVIGWGHKYKETLDYFGLGEFSLDFGDEKADLQATLQKLQSSRQEVIQKLAKHLPDVRSKAEIQFHWLDQVLE